jgi:hypothetical protein
MLLEINKFQTFTEFFKKIDKAEYTIYVQDRLTLDIIGKLEFNKK